MFYDLKKITGKLKKSGYSKSYVENKSLQVKTCVFTILKHFPTTGKNSHQPYSRWAFLGLLTDGRGGKKPPPSPFSKICHTYPTLMKLGSYTLPKEDPKNT